MGPDTRALTVPPAPSAVSWWTPWLVWLDDALHREIGRLRARYELSLDEFRGLYISDEHVDRLLAPGGTERAVTTQLPVAATDSPLGRLALEFSLGAFEVATLFVALAPELDAKYETLFAYLNDDVTRRSATVDLCRRLTGAGPGELDLGSALFAEGLVDATRPGATRSWRSAGLVVGDAARRFLLGGDALSAVRRARDGALDALAVRVPLIHSWADLVLPSPTLRRLHELTSAVRNRDRVFREWGFLRPAGGTAAVRAMFSGASGTGKTLSAAVVARELGMELFRIDLSAVVSKYIGETEKNLERVFTVAESLDAILLFDEADALFGKRSEVRDAHDRYANIEVAYLLQRLETYGGVVILATNLARNLDEAFARRIHIEVEFPVPDEVRRGRMWELLLPASAPTTANVDRTFLARQFQLTGGEIRNAALTAAFLAAHDESEISMGHLVRAVARQRRKQGKLPAASEFKHHLAAVRGDGA